MADHKVLTVMTPMGATKKIKWYEKRPPTDAEVDEIARTLDREATSQVNTVMKSPFFGGQDIDQMLTEAKGVKQSSIPMMNRGPETPKSSPEDTYAPGLFYRGSRPLTGEEKRGMIAGEKALETKRVAGLKAKQDNANKQAQSRGILGQFGESLRSAATFAPDAREQATALETQVAEALKGSRPGRVLQALSPSAGLGLDLGASVLTGLPSALSDVSTVGRTDLTPWQTLGALTNALATGEGAVANIGAAKSALQAGKGIKGALAGLSGATAITEAGNAISDALKAANAKKAVQAVGDRIKVKTVKEPVVPFDMTPSAKANLADFEKRSAGYAPTAGPEGGVIDIRSLLSEPPPDIPKTIAAPQGAPAQGAPSALSGANPYLGNHRPVPPVEGGSIPAHDASEAFPDIYSKEALQIYGSGATGEADILRTLRAIRGKPDAQVTIYRGVSSADPSTVINPGDWVTFSKAYASEYAADGGRVIEMKVPARDVTVHGDALTDQAYFPAADLPAVDFRPNTGMGTLTEGQRTAAMNTPKQGITTEQSLADDLAKSLEQAQAAKGAKPKPTAAWNEAMAGAERRANKGAYGGPNSVGGGDVERMWELQAGYDFERAMRSGATVEEATEKTRQASREYVKDHSQRFTGNGAGSPKRSEDAADKFADKWARIWQESHSEPVSQGRTFGTEQGPNTEFNTPTVSAYVVENGEKRTLGNFADQNAARQALQRERKPYETPQANLDYRNSKVTSKQGVTATGRKSPKKLFYAPGDSTAYATFKEAQVAEHRAQVQQALAEGKPVPANVLKDYPDLAKNAPKLSKAQAAEQNVKRIAVERAQAKGEYVSPEDLQAAGLKAPASPVDAPKGAGAVEVPAGQKDWNSVVKDGIDVIRRYASLAQSDEARRTFGALSRSKELADLKAYIASLSPEDASAAIEAVKSHFGIKWTNPKDWNTDQKFISSAVEQAGFAFDAAHGEAVRSGVRKELDAAKVAESGPFPTQEIPAKLETPDIPAETPRTARNADSAAIAAEEGIIPPKGKDEPFNIRQSQEAAKANYSEEAAKNIVGDFEAKNRPLTADETGTLSTHVEKLREARATLRAKAATGDADAIDRLATNTKDLERTLQTLKSGGSESSASMNVRRNLDLVDYSDPDEVVAEAKGQLATEELPAKLEKALRDHAKELAAKEEEFGRKEAEYKRLLAEAIANNEGKTRPRGAARTADQIRADIARRAAERQARLARTEKRAAKARQGGAVNVSAEDLQYLAQQARDYIQLGATNLADIARAMKADGIDATVEEVADALTHKAGQRTRSELQKRMDALRKEANALSPTAQARREAVKAGREANADSVKVAKIRAEIADLQEQLDTHTYVIKDAVARVKGSEDLERLRMERARLKSQIRKRIEDSKQGATVKAALAVAQNVRGTMLGGDLGVLTRQGKTALGNPREAIPAFGRAVTAARSEAKAHALEQDILKRFDAAGGKKTGLSLTVGTDEGEELGVAGLAKWAGDRAGDFAKWSVDKVLPGKGTKVGDAIRNAPGGLERFQKIYMNEYRMRAYEQAKKARYSANELADRAAFINVTTGRSNIKSVGPLMQTIFTSPRFEASRWAMLGSPVTQTYNLGKAVKSGQGLNRAALRNIKDLTKDAAITLGVIEAAKRSGYSFNWDDDTKSDYMKLRRGNEVWDISAGLAPRLRDLMKVVAQFRADPHSSAWTETLGKAVGRAISPSIKTTTGQPSIAYQRYVNGASNPKDPWSGFKNDGDAEGLLAFGPLIIQAVKQTLEQTQDPAEAAGTALKEFLGGSSNRY